MCGKICSFLFCILTPLSIFAQSEWPIYAYSNICTFRVPRSLELRDPYSVLGEFTQSFKEYYQMNFEDEIVFQQSGLNSDNLEVVKQATPLYARIIIRCIPVNGIDQKTVASGTQADINELGELWKKDVMQYFSGPDFKWYPVTRKKIGGKYALITRYQRPGAFDNIGGPVYVEEYKFFLTGKLIRFTLSYRLSESNRWKEDFSNIMNTLSFN